MAGYYLLDHAPEGDGYRWWIVDGPFDERQEALARASDGLSVRWLGALSTLTREGAAMTLGCVRDLRERTAA